MVLNALKVIDGDIKEEHYNYIFEEEASKKSSMIYKKGIPNG